MEKRSWLFLTIKLEKNKSNIVILLATLDVTNPSLCNKMTLFKGTWHILNVILCPEPGTSGLKKQLPLVSKSFFLDQARKTLLFTIAFLV